MNVIQEQGRQHGSYFYHIGDGFYYHVVRASDSAVYFTCKHSSCRGKATWIFGHGFTHTMWHNHGPDLMLTEVNAARKSIIDQARSLTYVSFANIIATERARLENRELRAQLTLRRLRPAMQRARGDIFPNLPQNLPELSAILQNPLWGELTATLDGQDGMYLGSSWSEDGSHNIVFASKRCLQLMRMTSIIFADGTFFIKPSVDGCYQVVPLCWCLMERKTEAAYVAVLLILRTYLGWWNFVRVICDFEDAMIRAFELVFQVAVQGCFFHAVNAMSKHAKSIIGVPFLQYLEVHLIVKLCCTLPLLPHDLLQRGLNVIGRFALTFHPLMYAEIRPFLCYVQFEWLDHANRGATLSVCGSFHRTNNARECFEVYSQVEHAIPLEFLDESNNGRMNRRFGVHHPNVFHFIRELAKFEDTVIDDVHSLSIGLIPTRHRPAASVSNDENIQRLTTQLLQHQPPTDEEIVQFLFQVSYSVQNVVVGNLHL